MTLAKKIVAWKEYLVVIYLSSGPHVTLRIPARGPKSVKSVEYNGHRYTIDPEAAFDLKGWYPHKPHHLWWSDYRDIWPRRRIGLLIYDEPADPLANVVLGRPPLDRRATLKPRDITPSFIRTMNASKVYREYEKSQRFGGGLNIGVITILLAAGLVVLVLLLLGGYV